MCGSLGGSQLPQQNSCTHECMHCDTCDLPGMQHIYPLVWHLRQTTTTTAYVARYVCPCPGCTPAMSIAGFAHCARKTRGQGYHSQK